MHDAAVLGFGSILGFGLLHGLGKHPSLVVVGPANFKVFARAVIDVLAHIIVPCNLPEPLLFVGYHFKLKFIRRLILLSNTRYKNKGYYPLVGPFGRPLQFERCSE